MTKTALITGITGQDGAYLISEMVREDLGQAQRYGVLRAGGFDVRERRE